VKEKVMKIASKTQKVGLIAVAVSIGLATVALVSTDLFSLFVSPSATADSAKSMVVTAVASPGTFFPQAAAAVSSTPLHSSLSSAVDGDSRSDNYRLERDSCCIGN
jgi:hypothetical protein